METEGRMVDLIDQIHCAASFFNLAVLRRWQAVVQVRKKKPCIPPNKVRIWSFEWGFLGQALLCLVAFLIAAALPWREPNGVVVKALGASFNKAQFGRWGSGTGSALCSSSVRRAKPHKAGRRTEAGISGKHRNRKGHGDRRRLPYSSDDESSGSPAKVKSAGRRRRVHKGGDSGRHDAGPERQVGTVVASRTRSRNGDRRKVASAAKYPARADEMEEVSSDDNRESRDNKEEEEEEDVVKGKNKVDDDGDSEDMYKSLEEKESGEDGNAIHDHSYAGVDEEDADDTTEPEEEEEGGEEEVEESHQAGEELRGTPSSNAKTVGNVRPDGDGTPPVRTKYFEGLCLVDKADTTSAGKGLRKRTLLQRRCSNKKLLTRGTFSKPYCIDVSESEPEEEVPPPAQTEKAHPSDWAFEDDSGGDDRAPAKKRQRRQQFSHSDDSDSEDGSDDSESDRTFARNAKKGPSSSRPANSSALYRQQQPAKEGRKDYAGCCNPRRIKNYAANAGNPVDRGNLQMQGDISFKKKSLLPQKGKRGKLSAEQDAYQDLFNSIFDEIEKYPNGTLFFSRSRFLPISHPPSVRIAIRVVSFCHV